MDRLVRPVGVTVSKPSNGARAWTCWTKTYFRCMVNRPPGAVATFWRGCDARAMAQNVLMTSGQPAGTPLGMEELFRRDVPGRGAFLSRMFAFFSEEIVRHWARCECSPYRDLGRPVVWDDNGSKYHVLDFTLERVSDGARFVTELKCEIEFEHYRYLTLTDPGQLEHHTRNGAFQSCFEQLRIPKLSA